MSKKNQTFSITKRLRSFAYAFNGLSILLKEEHNARIHLVATVLVIVLGFLLRISAVEWMMICAAIGWVWAMEIVNSAIENIADYLTKEKHESIKRIKDLAAAAVLVSALTAVVVGLIIFAPKLWALC